MENCKFIKVAAGVRYWEDASVNGVEDLNGDLIPFKNRNLWCPIIRLEDGFIVDWPIGTTADIHYKVCDAGKYWLLDGDLNEYARWAGDYVPDDFLCHGDNGYGDYIIFKVRADGFIEGWKNPDIEFVCDSYKDSQIGWEKINGLKP